MSYDIGGHVPIFLIKSILSAMLFIISLISLWSMFETLGRPEKKYNTDTLKKIHRLSGISFIVMAVIISFICIGYIIASKAELSSRATFHSVFSLLLVVLITIKILFVKVYRQFYPRVQTLGIMVFVLAFLTIGTSAGYYFAITKMGTDLAFDRSMFKEAKKETPVEAKQQPVIIKTDNESIAGGKGLYSTKCFNCHDPETEKTIVGPGHKGIMKNPVLPSSKRPSTPENILLQLKRPFKEMPSFEYLTEDEVAAILAYLNTL